MKYIPSLNARDTPGSACAYQDGIEEIPFEIDEMAVYRDLPSSKRFKHKGIDVCRTLGHPLWTAGFSPIPDLIVRGEVKPIYPTLNYKDQITIPSHPSQNSQQKAPCSPKLPSLLTLSIIQCRPQPLPLPPLLSFDNLSLLLLHNFLSSPIPILRNSTILTIFSHFDGLPDTLLLAWCLDEVA